jgi:hypothetical protein
MALHSPHNREIGRIGLPGYIDIASGVQGDSGGTIAPAPSERIVEDQSSTAGAPGARNEK